MHLVIVWPPQPLLIIKHCGLHQCCLTMKHWMLYIIEKINFPFSSLHFHSTYSKYDDNQNQTASYIIIYNHEFWMAVVELVVFYLCFGILIILYIKWTKLYDWLCWFIQCHPVFSLNGGFFDMTVLTGEILRVYFLQCCRMLLTLNYVSVSLSTTYLLTWFYHATHATTWNLE